MRINDDDGNMTTRNLAGQTAQTSVWDDGQRLEKPSSSMDGIYDTRVRRKTGNTYTYYHADGTEYTPVFGKKKSRKTSKPGTPAHDDLVKRIFTAARRTSCG